MLKNSHKQKSKRLLAKMLFSLFILPVVPQDAFAQSANNDIYVEENRVQEEVKSDSQATTIITAEDIKEKQAKSVEEIIFTETGVVRNVDPMGRVSLSLRGSEPRHVLILVDGHPVLGEFAKYAGKGDELNRIGTENVERIEIIRGGASSRYGSDAIGGVINIITKKAQTKENIAFNFEMRGIKDENLLPHKNFFLRADSGKHGKLKTALYGSNRTVMPIKSEKFFYYGVNTTAPIQNTLRYFGDISTIGFLGTYDLTKDQKVEFSAERITEDMNRFTKHSEDAPDPVINYRRNLKRDNLRFSYLGTVKNTDFQVDFNSHKMKEDDVTISSVKAFTAYEGQNTLHYLDHILHKEYNLTAKFTSPLGTKHLLSYGFGIAKEDGEGSRLKGAKKTYTRHIDPWDYDKNLNIFDEMVFDANVGEYVKKKKIGSNILDRPMALDENGIPQYDENYAKYGYRDEHNKTVIPIYTEEDYDDDEDENKKAAFAKELREQNPPEAFLDEDGDSFADDDDTVVRRYYKPNNFNHVRWHGKEFREEEKSRKNRQTIGKETINKRHFFLADFFQVNDSTILEPSMRLDHTNLFGSHLTFNLGTTKSLNKNNTQRLKANIGTAYTTPGMGELYYHFEMYAGMPHDIGVGRLGYYWFGNQNLKPEKSFNIDLAYEQETKNNRLRLNVFHNKIKDYMTPYFTGKLMDFNPEYNEDVNKGRDRWIVPPDMIYSFKNLGRAEITGIETEVQSKIDEHFSTRLGYTYLNAKNKSDKNMPSRLLNKPKHKLDFGINYENKKGSLRASLWTDYYINMLDANTIANNGNFVFNDSADGKPVYKYATSGAQTYEQKTFGLWNFILQKEINHDAMLYLGIDNLFNHRDDDLAMPERTYKMGLNVKFATIPLKSLGEDSDPFTLNKNWFIREPFLKEKKKGIIYQGTYEIMHDSFTGKTKPAKARVTSTSHVGTAYKNYLEKAESGTRQKLKLGIDSRLDEKTNLKIFASLSDDKDIREKKDIGTMKLNKVQLDELDLTRSEEKWTFSLGRLAEKLGVSGYYFGNSFDGVRAIYTDKDTQVRLGFGDFSHSTGIKDSPYTHARHEVFMRPPTKKEWLGYDQSIISSEKYQTAELKTRNGISLYAKLKKAKSLEEERQVLEEYLKIIRQYDTSGNKTSSRHQKTSAEKILSPSQYQINSHVWRKATVYDNKGKEVGQFMVVDVPQVSTIENGKIFDKDHLKAQCQTAFDNNHKEKRRGSKKIHIGDTFWNNDYPLSLGKSGLITKNEANSSAKYKVKFEFYGYGTYKGKQILESLGSNVNTPFGKAFGMRLRDFKAEEFQSLTKDEARERTGAALYDKDVALGLVRKNVSNGSGGEEEALGYQKAEITPILEQILNKAYASGDNAAWTPEKDSTLPLHLLAKAGYIFSQEGTVLVQDEVPSIKRAIFVDVKKELSPALGIGAFYLRSVNDKDFTLSFATKNENDHHTYDQYANVFGIGSVLRLGQHAKISLDYGKNITDLAKSLNGETIYEHEFGGLTYMPEGRKEGSHPSFFALRFDVGKTDFNESGTWNAFIDYKAFQHGAFFGGNGTEALPDRYLDGIKSYTVGLGYVPDKNLLLEAFYTFNAKGMKKRDTLYGAENFSLGNYTRVKLTYKF